MSINTFYKVLQKMLSVIRGKDVISLQKPEKETKSKRLSLVSEYVKYHVKSRHLDGFTKCVASVFRIN